MDRYEYNEYDPLNDMNDPEYERRKTGYYETNEFEEDDMFNKLTPEEQEKEIRSFAEFAKRVKNGDYGLEEDIIAIASNLFEKGHTSKDTEVILDELESITDYFRKKFGEETAQKATAAALEGIKKELDSMKKPNVR